jgi:hypothetical protein
MLRKYRGLPVCVWVLLAPLSFGCSDIMEGLLPTEGLAGLLDSPESTINNAAARIEAESDQWQVIAEELRAQLAATEPQIARDIERVIQQGVAAMGADARCTADFAGRRVQQGLEDIVAELTGQPRAPRTPVVCNAPSSFDLNDANRTTLEWSGYDLDELPLGVYLEVAGRSPVDLTRWSTAPVPGYRLVLDTSEAGGLPVCGYEEQRSISLVGHGRQGEWSVLSVLPVIAKECPEAPPTPPRATARELVRTTREAGGLFGVSTDVVVGGPTTSGYERLQCQAIARLGSGSCGNAQWLTDNPADARCSVHLGAPNFGSITCEVIVTEMGVQPPAGVAPDCGCW